MSSNQLSPGSAKTSIKQDALGRDRFVKNLAEVIRNYGKSDSLTIGLYGPWGCGKSTLLNFVIEDLGEDPESIAVLRFNPWNFSQQETLISAFFAALSALIKRNDNSRRAKKAAALLDTLSGLTAPAALAPGFGVIPQALKQFADAAKDYARAFGDLEETKRKISDVLRKSPKRFVIVIDDIDRLTEPEIRLIFQLAKSMADFTNVVYVMAFDRKIVAKALDGITGGEGNAYLEKVITVPINVPPLTGRQAQRLIKAEIDAYSKRQRAFDWHNKRQEEVETLIVRIVETVRQIERFTNALKVLEGLTKDDINFTDLIALTFLKATEPSLYDFISAHPEIFVDDMMNQLLRGDDQDEVERKTLDAEIAKLSMKSEDAVELLEIVFPKIARLYKRHGGSKHWGDREWRRQFRACADYRTFFRYFALQVDEGDISAADRKALHESLASVEDFEAFLRSLGDEGRRYFTMQYLSDVQPDELTDEQIEVVVTAILDIGDELGEGPSEEAIVACNALLKALTDRRRFEVTVAALGKPPASIEMPVVLINRLGSTQIATFNRQQAEQLSVVEAQLLKRAWGDGKLISHKRMLYLVNQWLRVSADDAKKTIRETLDGNDAEFLKFLSLYENVQTQASFYPVRFYVEGISRIYTLEELKERLGRLSSDARYETENERLLQMLAEVDKALQPAPEEAEPQREGHEEAVVTDMETIE